MAAEPARAADAAGSQRSLVAPDLGLGLAAPPPPRPPSAAAETAHGASETSHGRRSSRSRSRPSTAASSAASAASSGGAGAGTDAGETSEDRAVHALVLQHLDSYHFEGTKQAFAAALQQRKCVLPADALARFEAELEAPLRAVQTALRTPFLAGQSDAFWHVWEQQVPAVHRESDAGRRLEFDFQIAFAIAPARATLSKAAAGPGLAAAPASTPEPALAAALAGFKRFLENRGSSLAQLPEYLPYYALPYVAAPQTHPAFSTLFEAAWWDARLQQLDAFLAAHFAPAVERRGSRLVQLVAQADRDRDALRRLAADQQRVQTKLRHLQSDYHSLIGVASDLVQTIAASLTGAPITAQYLSAIVMKLSAFKTSAPASRAPSGAAGAAAAVDAVGTSPAAADAHAQHQRPPPAPTAFARSRRPSAATAFPASAPFAQPPSPSVAAHPLPPPAWVVLDSAAVTACLQSTDPSQTRAQALLLQALTHRLLSAPTANVRRQTIAQWGKADLFAFAFPPSPTTMAAHLLAAPAVLEQTARLLNVVASEYVGRNALVSGLHPPGSLVALLHTCFAETLASETATAQHLLGCCQKLSLRRRVQNTMNALAFVPLLLFRVLTPARLDALHPYTVEYAMALVMNLCIRSAGRAQCAKDSARVLETLRSLLADDDAQTRTYVHGTLYALLAERSIREQARNMGFDALLADAVHAATDAGDPDEAKQLAFVRTRLASDDRDDDPADGTDDDAASQTGAAAADGGADDEDYEDDADFYDPGAGDVDVGADDGLAVAPHERAGEALLTAQYAAPGRPAMAFAPTAAPTAQPSPALVHGRLPPTARSRTHTGPIQHPADFLRPVTPSFTLALGAPPLRPATGSRPSSRPASAASASAAAPRHPSAALYAQGPSRANSRRGSVSSTSGRRAPSPSASAAAAALPIEVPRYTVRKGEPAATVADRQEFTQAFATRPKVPRTPIGPAA
ncbi:hypothetical protein CXG81DRAFT_25600 [Caulochytrium protostelioides]|uniref:LisH domain-containing protein ARMC9 n=1 Tax=Caulochytrium protostelioides TaxID=1555241 RepID=A0A4P9X9R7_9FUNG|nr:hypothetical protein CXG81DRAFT_25600 [Caulochytrium protostelioides]|eukprot:RKP01761.1 hypothetical protein CXG81DRAFT_25600 [Caulochytrium protostelioides]